MKPIRKEPFDDKPVQLTDHQVKNLLETQFEGKSLEDLQKDAEDIASDLGDVEPVDTFLLKRSLIRYKDGVISHWIS